MGNLKYRNDNKKLLLWVYVIFIFAIIGSLIINVLNTKNVINMYIIAGVLLTITIAYLIFYPIFVKKNKKPLQLKDNYLAFYVSFYKNNKMLKKLMFWIDILELVLIVGVSSYCGFVMKMKDVYSIYSLIA